MLSGVTFVGQHTSLSSPTPQPPRTSTHPPSSSRHFRSRKTRNTRGEYLYNNCFFSVFVHKRKNGSKIAFFVSCTKRKKPKNGSRIAFSFFCTRPKKGKNGSRIAFSVLCTRREKIDETEVNLLFRSFALNVKKKVCKRKCFYRFSR